MFVLELKRVVIYSNMKQKEERNNYFKKLRAPAQSKLNGGNIIKVKNTWPMSTIRYETGFINREIKYLNIVSIQKQQNY